LLKARILLKADVSEAGDGWSDSRIETWETTAVLADFLVDLRGFEQ
jgi:hypothetical protein